MMAGLEESRLPWIMQTFGCAYAVPANSPAPPTYSKLLFVDMVLSTPLANALKNLEFDKGF